LKLKVLRIAVSLLFFSLFIMFYFSVFSGMAMAAELLGATQLIPAFIKFAAGGFIAAGAGVLVVLALTFVFGRVYCSFICPFGVLQDIFIFFRYKFAKRRVFRLQKNKKVLRYTVAAVVIIAALAGIMVPLNLTEPFSNFGRITAEVIKPAAAFINNTIAGALENFRIYAVKRTAMHIPDPAAAIYTVLFLILIFFLALGKGRMYCNTVCPAGALLGLAAKVSLFKIRPRQENCVSCGMCAGVCKAGCIDTKAKKVDNETCVSCFNCVAACRKTGIEYSFQRPGLKENTEKREFIKKTIAVSAAALVSALPKPLRAGSTEVIKENPIVTPPGSKSYAHFNKRCTACHLCVSACPTKVIKPSFFEHGIEHLLQPRLDFDDSYCLYDCVICSEVCPTGAIKKVTKQEKRVIQIGIAVFRKKNCVVYEKETDCGLCNEYCPTKAASLIPYKDGLLIPEVIESICIGCGACEKVCPAVPNKAIYVEGSPVHGTAEEPHKRLRRRERKGRGEAAKNGSAPAAPSQPFSF